MINTAQRDTHLPAENTTNTFLRQSVS